MNKLLFYIFWIILLFSIYHLIRDVLQIMGVHHYLIDIWHRSHLWCSPYCLYVTLVPEIFSIVAIPILLKRNKIGVLGVMILLSIPIWLLMSLLP